MSRPPFLMASSCAFRSASYRSLIHELHVSAARVGLVVDSSRSHVVVKPIIPLAPEDDAVPLALLIQLELQCGPVERRGVGEGGVGGKGAEGMQGLVQGQGRRVQESW